MGRDNMKEAWDARWTIVADANGDGKVSVSDVWLWFQYVFFAPGDLIILWIMGLPKLASFFEIGSDNLSGWGSGFISTLIWVAIYGVSSKS
jgi:hypothetical protein